MSKPHKCDTDHGRASQPFPLGTQGPPDDKKSPSLDHQHPRAPSPGEEVSLNRSSYRIMAETAIGGAGIHSEAIKEEPPVPKSQLPPPPLRILLPYCWRPTSIRGVVEAFPTISQYVEPIS